MFKKIIMWIGVLLCAQPIAFAMYTADQTVYVYDINNEALEGSDIIDIYTVQQLFAVLCCDNRFAGQIFIRTYSSKEEMVKKCFDVIDLPTFCLSMMSSENNCDSVNKKYEEELLICGEDKKRKAKLNIAMCLLKKLTSPDTDGED